MCMYVCVKAFSSSHVVSPSHFSKRKKKGSCRDETFDTRLGHGKIYLLLLPHYNWKGTCLIEALLNVFRDAID